MGQVAVGPSNPQRTRSSPCEDSRPTRSNIRQECAPPHGNRKRDSAGHLQSRASSNKPALTMLTTLFFMWGFLTALNEFWCRI